MTQAPPRLPPTLPGSALLINPPVYDTRFHWSEWHQPTNLLRLASCLRRSGTDVKLIDALYTNPGERLKRTRVDMLAIEELNVPKWRFGITQGAITRRLKELQKLGWTPDQVYVDCFTTFWWEGAQDAIRTVRNVFPNVHVVLFGTYASLAPEHAAEHSGADVIIREAWDGLTAFPAELTLHPTLPRFVYLAAGNGTRSTDAVIEEIREAMLLGVRQFVFADDRIATDQGEWYCTILEQIIARNVKAKFFALGNIAPRDFALLPDLARLMKQAGYAQIWLSDDRGDEVKDAINEPLVESYELAAKALHAAGFRARTDDIVAAVCLGRAGESLSERVKLATLAAHHLGSVIFWAYQPAMHECSQIPLEHQNGKLFPLREANEYRYRDYLDVLGLAAVLNAKYRDKTFDFLGENLIARKFRESLERRAWEPDPAVKGGLQLPLKVVR